MTSTAVYRSEDKTSKTRYRFGGSVVIY